MIQGMDDARPWRGFTGDPPLDLAGFLAEWRRRESVPICWCTPLEFSRAVAEHAEKLPVVRGVLDGCDCALPCPRWAIGESLSWSAPRRMGHPPI